MAFIVNCQLKKRKLSSLVKKKESENEGRSIIQWENP